MVKTGAISFENYYIPLKVYREWRGSVRYSIGKKYAILRVPKVYPSNMVKFELTKFETWISGKFYENQNLGKRFEITQYDHTSRIEVRGESFDFDISETSNKSSVAKINEGVIYFKMSNLLGAFEKQNAIKKMIPKIMAKYFKTEIELRVRQINERYFGKEIKSVTLKNNLSNWGSCSSKKNINLSTRLLLAPDDVLDYVIVHELAHLIEMNHSSKFWAIVKKIMPDYKQKEEWLSKNGHSLVF